LSNIENTSKSITEILIELQTIQSPIYRNIYEILECISNIDKQCKYIRSTILGENLYGILNVFNMKQIDKLNSYEDLLAYNKKFLNGELPCTFYYYNILIPDQSSELLIKLADKGFFTVDGQGNENKDYIKQREYSEGFIQKNNVEQLKSCIEGHPHLYGYIVDIKGNIILDKQNENWLLPNGSPDEKYSVTVEILNNTLHTFSSFEPSVEKFAESSVDSSGWWNDFKLFKDKEGTKIYTDIEELYLFLVIDDRWVKKDTDYSLIETILKCMSSSGGRRKTRKALRKKYRKTHKH
jgi:hypothetical protein